MDFILSTYRCYKSLIGGYLHYALADLTGFIPQQIVTRPGYVGYDAQATRDLWGKYIQKVVLALCVISIIAMTSLSLTDDVMM